MTNNNYNPNIHHRKSIRLRGYDYSKAGLYFITICTVDKKCLFGKIVRVGNENSQPRSRNKMLLDKAGEIANECWLQIPEHFPNVFLHDHIVMPNHIHGIIELINPPVGSVGVQDFEPRRQSTSAITAGVQNFEPRHNEYQKIIPHSIGSIIRGFKIGVTKWFRNNTDIEDVWQRNYYEHIIRNEHSYERIANYIIENPNKWEIDDFVK